MHFSQLFQLNQIDCTYPNYCFFFATFFYFDHSYTANAYYRFNVSTNILYCQRTPFPVFMSFVFYKMMRRSPLPDCDDSALNLLIGIYGYMENSF